MKTKKPTPGKFYIIYDDETEEYAISAHSSGFSTIEAAIEEANSSGETPIGYRVINSDKEAVHKAITDSPYIVKD